MGYRSKRTIVKWGKQNSTGTYTTESDNEKTNNTHTDTTQTYMSVCLLAIY